MTKKFHKDLGTGQQYENKALQVIHKKYPQAYIIDGYYKEWDIYIPELNIGVEVKRDAQYEKYGNFFLEYYCRNKPSGIVTTKAKYYFIFLDELYIVKTDFLLDKFLKYKGTKKDKPGGDDLASLGITLPINELK